MNPQIVRKLIEHTPSYRVARFISTKILYAQRGRRTKIFNKSYRSYAMWRAKDPGGARLPWGEKNTLEAIVDLGMIYIAADGIRDP